jgi:hypothetical protein
MTNADQDQRREMAKRIADDFAAWLPVHHQRPDDGLTKDALRAYALEIHKKDGKRMGRVIRFEDPARMPLKRIDRIEALITKACRCAGWGFRKGSPGVLYQEHTLTKLKLEERRGR